MSVLGGRGCFVFYAPDFNHRQHLEYVFILERGEKLPLGAFFWVTFFLFSAILAFQNCIKTELAFLYVASARLC